jgi:hypothetical protein
LDNLVWEDDRESIYDSIERTIDTVEPILLWQIDESGNRHKEQAFVQKFNYERGILLLVETDNKYLKLDKNKELFLKFKDRSLLFKTTIDKLGEDKVQISLPKNFRILENRDKKRRKLIEDSLKVKIDKSNVDIIGKTSFEFLAYDLSERGLGLLFSVTKLNSFSVGEKVVIKKFGERELHSPLMCKIVHITEHAQGTNTLLKKDYKMGLQFLDHIPEQIERSL